MQATVQARDDGVPCIVKWTGRRGLKVLTITYCGREVSAGDGVTQLPETVRTCGDCIDSIAQVST